MSNNGFLHTPGSGLADWNDLENKPSAPSNRFLGKGTSSSTNGYIDITLNGINGSSDISSLYQSQPNNGNSTSMIDLVFDKESNPVSSNVTFRIGGYSCPAYKGGLLANGAPVNFPQGFTFKPNTVYTFTWCKDGFYLVNVQEAIEEPKTVSWEDIEDKPDFKDWSFNEYDYARCTTAVATANKSISTLNKTFTLTEGSGVVVVFEDGNTNVSPKLSVNSTGYMPIVLKTGDPINSDTFKSGVCYLFKYEGGSYVCYGEAKDQPVIPSFYNTEIYGSFSCGRKADTSIGVESFAMGYSTEASGKYSHAEGNNTTASGNYSHAEGASTASGVCSHAEGDSTTASAQTAHAEGYKTSATGDYSHAEGSNTTAQGQCSHAGGQYTTALKYQYAIGHHNDTSLATETSYIGSNSNTTTGTALVIGNGGGSSSKSNACRITYAGQVIGKSGYASTGADYAEYFEWADANPDKEDRRGYFVTLDGDQIVKAKDGDFILGIISGHPCVIGNFDEHYRKQFEMDEFGDYIYVDDEGNPCKGGSYKINPDYDSSQPYVPRGDRPEWSAVGMMGKLRVHDDGSCQVNGYCRCNDQGKATASDRGYRVLNRINDHIIEVLFSMYASF